MTLKEAITLIESANIQDHNGQKWMDLGCGSGVFSRALGNILPPNSTIYAIDKTYQEVEEWINTKFEIQFLQLDFIHHDLPAVQLDGIIMANSLHYVKDPGTFLKSIKKRLESTSSIIIIEYNTDKPNPWIPYPLNYLRLSDVIFAAGFSKIRLLNKTKSIYGGEIYSAQII
ncbi:methyltransferase domain-containing protein [Echinicola sp. CAU 1574]|uniref:Methyltransferase domain-containing protein n=1 Tax=Echinicola arenosa TaxID=2774144 RepID=A0ABR9AFG1_9BACT|nr:class I SAM-dependent methyltransferase [Echinicola arenosa]MBD8487164.1 methyltransferase domain-containing protein [Echinicola arenosa]